MREKQLQETVALSRFHPVAVQLDGVYNQAPHMLEVGWREEGVEFPGVGDLESELLVQEDREYGVEESACL